MTASRLEALGVVFVQPLLREQLIIHEGKLIRPQADAGANSDEQVVDADFEEVDDRKGKSA